MLKPRVDEGRWLFRPMLGGRWYVATINPERYSASLTWMVYSKLACLLLNVEPSNYGFPETR